MCDYSLQNVKTRPAAVGDKLVTHNFGTGTVGFADPDPNASDVVAVCVLPGTEIAFDEPVKIAEYYYGSCGIKTGHTLARFRQINKDEERKHHDALEFPDGGHTLLTELVWGQRATVLQLPAAPKTTAEAQEQKRVAWAG